MSDVGGKAENMCSLRVFRSLTQSVVNSPSFDHLVGNGEQRW
jgi:hypothetical protein